MVPLHPRGSDKWSRETFSISMFFPSGQHFVRREYLLYDQNDLIADIGGYLGLLLGYSILSVFHRILRLCNCTERTV